MYYSLNLFSFNVEIENNFFFLGKIEIILELNENEDACDEERETYDKALFGLTNWRATV